MKGTVVATWMKTCRKLYGDAVVNNAMESVGWNSRKIFSPVENVDDGQVKNVIDNISKKQNISLEALWRTIGKDNITAFHRDFPAFFQTENVYSFLKSLFDIHVVMTKKFDGAKPPLVGIKPISSLDKNILLQFNMNFIILYIPIIEKINLPHKAKDLSL